MNFRFSGVAVFHLSAAMLAAGAVPAGDEAASATPFRALVSAEEVEKSIEEMKVDRMLADFAAGSHGFPECGWRVDFRNKDSMLIGLGVEVGSVVESRAGVRLLAYPMNFEPTAAKLFEAAGDLVWVTPQNERRSVAVPAGKLGYLSRSFANLPYWYLHHGRRDPKWDRQVVAALLQLGRQTELAETCWAEAVKRGYRPDRLSACSGMMLALSNGELSRAEVFAKDFVPFETSSTAGDFPTRLIDVYRLGFLTGNPEWLLKVGDSFLNDAYFSTMVENFRHQADLAKNSPAGTPPPSELAKGMRRRPFLRSSDTTRVRWSSMQDDVEKLHRRAAVAEGAVNHEFPPILLQSPINHYFSYYLSPFDPSPNIDVEIRFRAEAEPVPPGELIPYDRCFRFGLADRDHDEIPDIGVPADARILLTRLSFDGNDSNSGELPAWIVQFNGNKRGAECEVWPGSGRDMSPLFVPTHSPFPYSPEKVLTLRIVRVGGQAEALLDGRRLALVQVPGELRNPGLYIFGSGCRIHVSTLRAAVLE